MKNVANKSLVEKLGSLKRTAKASPILSPEHQQQIAEVVQTYIDEATYSEIEMSLESVMVAIFDDLTKKESK